jgi:hypothetical protein
MDRNNRFNPCASTFVTCESCESCNIANPLWNPCIKTIPTCDSLRLVAFHMYLHITYVLRRLSHVMPEIHLFNLCAYTKLTCDGRNPLWNPCAKNTSTCECHVSRWLSHDASKSHMWNPCVSNVLPHVMALNPLWNPCVHMWTHWFHRGFPCDFP